MNKKENSYIIPITGLSVGYREYQYVIDDSFFEMFDYSEVRKGLVSVNLGILKQESSFILSLKINGKVVLACDRCGDDYEQDIQNTAEVFLKYGDIFEENNDDVIVITKDECEFDVSSLIYEYIILALPIHRVHQDKNDCNPEVIKYLEENEVKETTEIDPRWKCLENYNKEKDN